MKITKTMLKALVVLLVALSITSTPVAVKNGGSWEQPIFYCK
jgi:hypothetical protein